MGNRFTELSESDLTSLVDQKNRDRMIKEYLNSIIPKIVISQCLADDSIYLPQPGGTGSRTIN